MKYLLTNEEMRQADAYTIESGVAGLTLMERAGVALADEAERLAPTGEILCVCGGGNNGGDGFVCARILRERGRTVRAVCCAEKFSADCQCNRQSWLQSGGEILSAVPDGGYALVVDCLYGTGFHGSLQGGDLACATAVNALRRAGAKVLACDIPSGVNGASGEVLGEGIYADVTLCIGERKLGAYLGAGIDYVGEIKRADIGIVLPEREYIRLTDRETVRAVLPARRRYSHKGSYGRAAIVAGSMEYTGAAYLSAAACLRSGAGYTTLFLPSELISLFALKAPEILLRESNEGGRYAFNEERMRELLGYDSVAFGMGMGVSEDIYLGAKWLLKHYTGKLILDADGLNSLAAYHRGEFAWLWKEKKCDVVLTPHAKEFSRLTSRGIEEVLKNGARLAEDFARERKVAVLLKGAVSYITDGERAFVNAAGNSGQAKGGTGDVLSGVLAGLCAQGVAPLESAVLGSYLVGKAAEIAARSTGEYSLTASDIIAHLGKAFLAEFGLY